MKKIFFSLLSILIVVAGVAGSGFAVFSASSNVDSASFTTGTAVLLYSADGQSWTNHYTFANAFATNVYPGYTQSATFWLNNTSTAPISLGIAAQLVSATGDFQTLAPVAHVTINGVDHTLQDWNTNPQNLNMVLPPNTPTQVNVTFSIPATAGNEIAGKTVSTNWVVTGTQQ